MTTFFVCLPGEGENEDNTVVEFDRNWTRYQIIDIHAHIGQFAGFDLSEATLLENLRTRGIARALVSNIDCAALPGVTRNLDEFEANKRTMQLVKAHPDLLRGLLWVRPTEGKIHVAKRFLELKLGGKGKSQPIFVGMKFHPEMNNFTADDTSVDPFLALCDEQHIPAVFHCGDGKRSAPQAIYRAARKHPHVPVVLYHMGFNTDHREAIECVESSIKNGDANLFLETSQCDADSVLQAIRSVGSSRVLFGTDASYFGKEHYARYDELIQALKKNLSEADFKNIVHDNALKLFAI